MTTQDDATVAFNPTESEASVENVNLTDDDMMDIIDFLAKEVITLRKELLEKKYCGVAS